MEKIVIQNFKTPSNGYSLSPHRNISGFMPHYTELAIESSDTDFVNKVNPPYPLVLAPALTTQATKTSKRIVSVVPNEFGSLASGQKVVYSTNDWHIYFDDTTETDFNQAASVTENDGVDIALYQAIVFTSFYSHAKVRFSSNGTWANHSGTPTNFGTSTIKLFRKFKNTLFISDGNKIYSLTTGAVSSLAFTLSVAGISPDIIDYNNFGDQYMVLFFELGTGTVPVYDKTDWVLWDGLNTTIYEFKKTLRGKYRCSIVRDNTIYAFTQLGTTLVCWQFNGNNFTEYGRMKNVVISTDLSNPKTRVAVENDFFVLMATSPGNITNSTPFYWNPATGDNFFLAEQTTDALAVAISQQSDAGYQRYISSVSGTADAVLQKITLENTTRFNTATYKTGLIQIPEGRGRIKRVIVEYNTSPPSISDRIDFTLNSRDDMQTATFTENTAVIKDTTASSTNANVESTRAIMDFRPIASEFNIELSLTKTTANYWLIVRKIVVEYEPIIEKQ